MSRWQEVRAEYRRIFEMDGTWRSSMSCLRDAQYLIRHAYHSPDEVTEGKMFIRRSRGAGGDCCCSPVEISTTEECLVTIVTYDDWGDGPQCTMCGRLKEVGDE